MCGPIMKAAEHPDYLAETEYLGSVLEAAEVAVRDLDTRDWRPAMLSDEETALVLHGWADKRRATLAQLLERPYFGRFDLDDWPMAAASTYYVGQAGLKHPRVGKRLVVDWRAEVAAAFYRPGPQVRLKRRYDIAGRALQGIHDDAIGADGSSEADPVLAQVLAGSRGQELRSIVATIQSEQDELIRAPDTFMLIQGGAGTGKTVVALHRLAYLLYFHRGAAGRAADLRVAVFGPNRLFLSYVASVLPTLGESDVYQTTFEDWFTRWCGRDAPKIPGFEDSLDDLLSSKRGATAEASVPRALLKGSERMGAVLDRFVTEHRARVQQRWEKEPFEFTVPWRFRQPLSMGVPPAVRQRCAQEIGQQAPNRARAWIRQWLWPRLRDQLDRRHGSIMHDGSRAPRQLVEEARKAFETALEQSFPELHFVRTYQALLSNPARLAELAEGILNSDELAVLQAPRRLGVEDLAPAAYLKLGLDGLARIRDPKGRETDRVQQFDHLVVDEAQDLAPLQLHVLRAHTSGATILGDLAQGISPSRGVRDWTDVEDMLREDSAPVRRVTLRQSYRSTRQIIAFANQIIGSIEVPGTQSVEPFPRDGDPPQLIRARDEATLVQEIAAILDDLDAGEFQTAAVICKNVQETRRISDGLQHERPGRFATVLRAADGRVSDVVVLPVYLAKGMDFDVVIVVDADARRYRQAELDAKLLYVAVTRALHRLYVLWTGQPSPLLPMPA